MIRKIERRGGIRWQVYAQAGGLKKYIGTYGTEAEAAHAEEAHVASQRAAAGEVVAFRVVAVYANGAEREVLAAPLTDHVAQGATEDREFAIWIERHPRAPESAEEVWLFNPETDIASTGDLF